MEFTITREGDDYSDDITVLVDYRYNAYGIQYEIETDDPRVGALTANEEDRLFSIISGMDE